MTTRRQDLIYSTLLILLAAGLAAAQIYWVASDRRPPTYDDSWYLETSLRLYRDLSTGGLKAFLPAYAGAFGAKAPLFSVLPLPLFVVCGIGARIPMLVNTGFIFLSSIYLFRLGRRLFSAEVGLAAVVFYQTMPLVYGLSRVFFPDYGLAALGIVWVYYLMASEELRRKGVCLALGVVLGLGLLMKVTFPAYVAAPLLVILWRRRREPNGPLWPALAMMALAAGAVASTWYAFHLREVFQYAWTAAYGDLGAEYGAGGFRVWAVHLVSRSAGAGYGAGLVGLGAAAWLWRRRLATPGPSLALVGWWLAPPLLASAAGANREIRLVIPLLPAMALLLAALVFGVARRPAAGWAVAGLLAVAPLRLFAAHSFSLPGPGPDLGWSRSRDARGEWSQNRVLEALGDLAGSSPSPRWVMLGSDHPYFNVNLFSYLNAYARYPLLFASLGNGRTTPDRAIAEAYRRDAGYLVLVEAPQETDGAELLHPMNREVRARLDRGELPYRRRLSIPLAHSLRAVIWSKDEPWMVYPPGVPAPAPAHPLVADFADGPRFLGYDWKRRDHHVAEISYYWTVRERRLEQDFRLHARFESGSAPLLDRDFAMAGGRRPFYDWEPGEVVKQTIVVFLPRHGELRGRLWLTPWKGAPRQEATEAIQFPLEQ